MAARSAPYGWPAYFSALYLPAGGERVLLGDHVLGGLPGRLLQVFLDLPSAALLTRVKAARDRRATRAKGEQSDQTRLRALQADRYEEIARELVAAREEFAALDAPDEAESVAEL